MQSEPSTGTDEYSVIFASSGPFSEFINDYQPRRGQLEMAQEVDRAIFTRTHSVIEAPSGAGKTLAYLVPAMIAGQKTIVSTATQFLQSQLLHNDIPLVQKALRTQRKICILRGRSSYLCPYYLQKSLYQDSGITKSTRLQLALLWQRYRASSIGLWSELLPALEPAAIVHATCSTEQCLGGRCPQYSSCPLMRVREQANRADIIIVNHSLLFSDQLMRKEQFSDFLPAADVVIVDEAHRLTAFAQNTVGHRLTSGQLSMFCRDAIAALNESAPEHRVIRDFIKKLERVIHRLRGSLPCKSEYQREQHISIVKQLVQALDRLLGWFSKISERAQSLREMEIRTAQLKRTLQVIQLSPGLCWVETTSDGFVLQNIPINLSKLMTTLFSESSATWLFTSATLSVAGDATRFLQLLGLGESQFCRVASAIDYQNNAGLYTPRLPVDPCHEDYSRYLTESAHELICQAGGRVLFLFTSHEMLQTTAMMLAKVCQKPLLQQGTQSNYRLIERFRQSDNAVLLGTGSFWEGLDLSGAPLSCVIIDKLPFASPSDPLVKLRTQMLMANGVDGFEHYVLADAVIRLRQGCGRLLRRLSDKGVIMIADPRLHSKTYGAVFINSLPAMTRSDTLAPLNKFLHHC